MKPENGLGQRFLPPRPVSGVAAAPLHSSVVQAALEAYAEAARGAFAANTERAVRADTAVFAAWCATASLSAALPVEPTSVAAFIDAMAETRKPATVTGYVASLNHLHRAAGLSVPGGAEPVRLALRRMQRSQSIRQRQAAPLGWDRLRRILPELGERLIDRRDAALLLLAYDTLARRSELASLDVGDIAPDVDGTGTALIRRSKTDQEGVGRLAFVSAATVRAIAAWLDAAAITTGPLFVPLGNARKAGRLSEGDVARISDAGPGPRASRLKASADIRPGSAPPRT